MNASPTRLVVVFCLVFTTLMVVSSAHAQQCGEWVPDGGLPGIRNGINAAVVWDPDGEGPARELLVVGGSLYQAGNVLTQNLATWDGERWQAVPPPSDYFESVQSLAVYDGELVVANYSRVYSWNGERWRQLGQTFGTGGVSTFLVWNGDLIAGGSFTRIGDQALNRVARWDGQSWHTMGEGFDGGVGSLKTYRGALIAAGGFTNSGSTRTPRIAQWDGRRWQPMGTLFDIPRSSGVSDLTEHEGLLFAATYISGVPVAAWNGTSWAIQAPSILSSASTMLSTGTDLFCAGFATPLCNSTGPMVARRSDGGWTPLVPRDIACCSQLANGTIRRLVLFRNELYAIGGFTSIGLRSAFGIARWDGEQWNALGGGFDGPIRAFHRDATGLLALGSFRSYAGVRCDGIARRQGDAWVPFEGGGLTRAAVGQPWCGSSNAANALAAVEWNGGIAVGGTFSYAGGVRAQNMAFWDGQHWQGWGIGPGVYPNTFEIRALAVFNGQLIAAGRGTSSTTTPDHLYAWDGLTWQSIGGGLRPGPNSPYRAAWVNALAVHQGRLIAAGHFGVAGAEAVENIAAWDGERWSAMSGVSISITSNISALCSYQGQLLAGAWYPWRWTGSSWVQVGDLGYQYYLFDIRSFTELNGELVVGSSAGYVGRFDGQAWQSPGSFNRDFAPAYALAQDGNDLLVGGDFDSSPMPYARTGPAFAYLATFRLNDETRVNRVWNQEYVTVGGSATFLAQSCGSGEMSFQWMKNGRPLSEGVTPSGSMVEITRTRSTSTLTVRNAQTTDAADYSCAVSAGGGVAVSIAGRIRFSCPADVVDATTTVFRTHDGAVTIEDLTIFLGALAQENQQADIDDGSGTGAPDGAVNVFDLIFFLEH